ncbi:excinuclease ABC, A subunit, partial [mine drainage metagenome]
RASLRQFAERYGYDLHRPVRELSDAGWKALLYGTDRDLGGSPHRASHWWQSGWLREGLLAAVERRWKSTPSDSAKEYYLGFMAFIPCPKCGGRRLKPESLAVTVLGRSIAEISGLTVAAAGQLFETFALSPREEQIAGQVVREIRARLRFLENVGLTYLTLDRGSGTLSGGEAERIALATQIGSGLVGVLYILDEPSIGLHAR